MPSVARFSRHFCQYHYRRHRFFRRRRHAEMDYRTEYAHAAYADDSAYERSAMISGHYYRKARSRASMARRCAPPAIRK